MMVVSCPMQPTVGHNWHVHEEASPSADTTCSPTVGGHYNPYDVSLGECCHVVLLMGGLIKEVVSSGLFLSSHCACCHSHYNK